MDPRLETLRKALQQPSGPSYGALQAFGQQQTQQPQQPQNKSLLSKLNQLISQNIVKPTVKPILGVGNLLGQAGAAEVALAKIAAANITKNKKARQRALQEYAQFGKKMQQTGGLGQAGMLGYTPSELGKPLAPGKLVATIAATGAQIAPLGISAASFAPVKAGFEAGATKGAAALSKYLAAEALPAGAGFAGSKAMEPGATTKDIIKAGLSGAALAAGTGLAVGGLSAKLAKGAAQGEKAVPELTQTTAKTTAGATIQKTTPTTDSVQTVIDALKQAKPLVGQQKKLYAQERAIRVAKAAKAGETISGEKGYYAQLGALKGQLPKVQFENIRKNLNQQVVDDLFGQVEKSNLSTFEKINAKTGLSKLFGEQGGKVPTKSEIALLSEVFPQEFVQTVLDKQPVLSKAMTALGETVNIPRSLMASVDLSAPFRQGLFLTSKPKQFAGAFKDMFKYAASEKQYQNLINEIRSRPSYKLMRDSKLSLTDINKPMLGREEAFMSNFAEKIPAFGRVVKASDRAYTGFLNKLRADVFDDLVKKANIAGVAENNPGITKDIATFVNNASGRGNLGKLERSAVALNSVFFSPRLIASRVNMLNPAYYVKLDPFVRKEALKSLLTVASVGTTIVGLAKMGGANVSTDPRSADFGKIKVGNTRYDMFGGLQQYAVLLSRLASGQMISSTTGKEIQLGEGYKSATRKDIIQKFVEGKLSPVASFTNQLLQSKNFLGEQLNVPATVADQFIPMIAQDMYDLYKDKGMAGILAGSPAIFGLGVQTYGEQIPIKSTTKTGKESVQFRSAPTLGERLTAQLTGQQLTNVPQSEWAVLRKQKEIERKYTDELTKTKEEVLKTGQTKTIYNPIKNKNVTVYIKNGVVKTKYK